MPRRRISVALKTGVIFGSMAMFAGPSLADHDPPTVFLMDNNNAETTCNGSFHDSGGPCDDLQNCDCISSCFLSEYEPNEDFVKTFRPQNGLSQKLRINFTRFMLEETPANQPLPFDKLEVYDGSSTSAPLIGVFFPRTDGTGTAPGIITSTAPDGSLTFKFHSDNTFSEEGWDASISCVDAYSPTFITSGQSMWGAGTTAKPPNSSPIEFLTIPFLSNSLGGTVISLLGKSFGGRLFGGISGDLGFQIRFKDIGAGFVGARYPAQVTLSGPPEDSYRAGDIITIESFVRVKPESAPYLDMATPQVTMNVDARIGLSASAGAQACVFNCKTVNVFPPMNLNGTGRIIGLDTVRSKATVINEEFIVTSTPVTIPALLTLATGVSGSLDTPSIGVPANPGSISVVGRTTLRATGSDFFTRLTMDVDKWILKALGTPTAVALESPCVPQLGCSEPPGEVPLLIAGIPVPIFVRFLILDLLLDTDFHEQFTYSFAPTLHASLVFPQPLQHTIRRGSTVLHSGTSTVIEFHAGDSIDVVVPDADIGGTPTFSLRNTQFSTETSTRVVRSYREKAFFLGVRVPGVHVGCIPRVCVARICTPGFCVNSPEIKFTLGPLVDLNVAFDEFTDSRLFQKPRHDFQLGGFSSVVDGPFAINPEFQPVARIDGPVGPVNEGDAVPFSASPSTDGDNNPLVFTWDFGDGGTGQGPTTGENITHAYGDNGEYTVTLTADDGHGLPGVTTHTVTVLNVAPTIPPPALAVVNLDEGEVFTLDTSATDPGFLDEFVTNVEWGDGTTTGSSEQSSAQGPIPSFDHVYADNGEYAVSLCVRDDDGGVDCESLATIVTNLAPTCEVVSSIQTHTTAPASAVDLDMRLVSSFNDLGTLDTHNAPAGSSWIDWDDGTTTVLEIPEAPFGPPGFEFGANGLAFGLFDHSFSDRRTALTVPDSYQLRMCVADDDGGEVCTDIAEVEVPSGDLRVTKVVIEPTPPDPVLVGENIRYSLVVENNGPDAVSDVRLTDVLPPGTSLVSAVHGTIGALETQLLPNEPSREGGTGETLAIDGGTILLGSPPFNEFDGAVFVFVAQTGGDWVEQQKLVPSVPVAFSSFGFSLAIQGDTAIIAGGDQVYVFNRVGETWTEQGILLNAGGVPVGGQVAISGDRLVVGADAENTVYLFEKIAGVWTEKDSVLNASPGFPGKVAISRDRFAAAVRGDLSGAIPGSVSIYRFTNSGSTLERTINETDLTQLPGPNTFATSIAFDADTLVIGTNGGATLPGAAHVFVRDGVTWTEQGFLTATDPILSNEFGISVAVQGDAIVVGEPVDDNGRGALYVFERNGTTWSQRSKLTASIANVLDGLGASVAVDGGSIVGGAPNLVLFNNAGQRINSGGGYVFATCPQQPIGTVTCGLGTIASGESAIVEIVARAECILAADPSDPSAVFMSTDLVNSASAFGIGLEENPGDNSASATTATAPPTPGVCSPDVTPPLISPVVNGTLGDNSWYTSDVTVNWVVIDYDSPVRSKTGCGETTVSVDTSMITITCTAMSDGGSATESVSFKRDATPPEIVSSIAGTMGSASWYITDVEVSFICTDGFSGIANCTGPTTFVGEGLSPPVFGTATDNAGNTATTTVSDIMIDKTPPTITAIRTPPNANGWNNGDVTVTFSCTDHFSGLATCSPPALVSAEGPTQSVMGTATDVAGHSIDLLVDQINLDKTPPTIAGGASPLANANGWNNTIVTVSFACSDALSGIESCTDDTLLNVEGVGQSASGMAVDLAGNSAANTQSGIDIDFTPPTIIADASPPPDPEGRNDPIVTVSFTCNDDRSGVVACPPSVALGDFGFGQSAEGTVMDLAGNIANTSLGDIHIGRPTITPTAAQSGNEGELLDLVIATLTPIEATTGVATITWGDSTVIEPGTIVGGSGEVEIRGTHVYADNGLYNVEVCAEDLGGQPLCVIGNIEIFNVAPVVMGLSGQLDPVDFGTPVSIDAVFKDLGTADIHTAKVNWGDDPTPELVGVIEAPFGPPGNISGLEGQIPTDHAYTIPGDYIGEVCVTDDENATDCMAFAVTVESHGLPACSIAVGDVGCEDVIATIPLSVNIENGLDLPTWILWGSDNPNGVFDDIDNNDFDDATSRTPTLVTDASVAFNVQCTVVFPDGSGLDPVTCEVSITGRTFAGVQGCENVVSCTTDFIVDSSQRIDSSQKGSLLIYPDIELKWDADGNLTQDTVIAVTNDHSEDVFVRYVFVNGDADIDAVTCCNPPLLIERAHAGWNIQDWTTLLTNDQPTYFSLATGGPAGAPPFTALDNGAGGPGRPDVDSVSGGRHLRGYALAWAVDSQGNEIGWNHLSGDVTMVDYAQATAWEYGAYAAQTTHTERGQQPADCVEFDETGQCCFSEIVPGRIGLDGFQYESGFDALLFEFFASGSSVGSASTTNASFDTDLTLLPISNDFRQNGAGPVTAQAGFDIWNQNEIRFSGTTRCMTCWDKTSVSKFDAPSHFLVGNLQTNKGKARIHGDASATCAGSVDVSFIGVATKRIAYGGADFGTAATARSLVGQGNQAGLIEFDIAAPTGELSKSGVTDIEIVNDGRHLRLAPKRADPRVDDPTSREQ